MSVVAMGLVISLSLGVVIEGAVVVAGELELNLVSGNTARSLRCILAAEIKHVNVLAVEIVSANAVFFKQLWHLSTVNISGMLTAVVLKSLRISAKNKWVTVLVAIKIVDADTL